MCFDILKAIFAVLYHHRFANKTAVLVGEDKCEAFVPGPGNNPLFLQE